jgi:hypothetical protein
MGGKSHSSNDEMVQFEKEQAAQTQQQEADRQARLAQGTQSINDIFNSANFNDDFYNKYNQAALDYTEPQLATQYQQATNKLTYDLARAGTLRSSAAGTAQGLLSQQNLADDAALRAQADQGTATLRQNIANEKQQAINQLYSTEDPTIASNTAAGMVAQSQISTPNLNPLGAMFTPLTVGAISAANQALQNYYFNQNITGGQTPAPATGGGSLVTSPTATG